MIKERVNLLTFFEARRDRLGSLKTDDAGHTYYSISHSILNSLFGSSNGSISYGDGQVWFYYPLGTFYANIQINNNFHHKISWYNQSTGKRIENCLNTRFTSKSLVTDNPNENKDYPLAKDIFVTTEREPIIHTNNKVTNIKNQTTELSGDVLINYLKKLGFSNVALESGAKITVDTWNESISVSGKISLYYPFIRAIKCKNNTSTKYFKNQTQTGKESDIWVDIENENNIPFKEISICVSAFGLYQWHDRNPLNVRANLDWVDITKGSISAYDISDCFSGYTLVDDLGYDIDPRILEYTASLVNVHNYQIQESQHNFIGYNFFKTSYVEDNGTYQVGPKDDLYEKEDLTNVDYWAYGPNVYPVILYNEFNGINKDLSDEISVWVDKDTVKIQQDSEEIKTYPFDASDDSVVIYRRKPKVKTFKSPFGFVIGNVLKADGLHKWENPLTDGKSVKFYQAFNEGINSEIGLDPVVDTWVLNNTKTDKFYIGKNFDSYDAGTQSCDGLFTGYLTKESVDFFMKVNGVRDRGVRDKGYLAFGGINTWENPDVFCATPSLTVSAKGDIPVFPYYGFLKRYSNYATGGLENYMSMTDNNTASNIRTGWSDTGFTDCRAWIGGPKDVKFGHFFAYFVCNPGILPIKVPIFSISGKTQSQVMNDDVNDNTYAGTRYGNNFYLDYLYFDPAQDTGWSNIGAEVPSVYGFTPGYYTYSRVGNHNNDDKYGYVICKLGFESGYTRRVSAAAVVIWRNAKKISSEYCKSDYPVAGGAGRHDDGYRYNQGSPSVDASSFDSKDATQVPHSGGWGNSGFTPIPVK